MAPRKLIASLLFFFFSVYLTLLCSCANAQSTDEPTDGGNSTSKRQGKVFSLFNVVQFKNTGCRSNSALASSGTTSSYRNGTCFTSSECISKGGTAAGNCAAGFGVCCLFLYSTSGSTISQNCSYIRNPGYPSTLSGTSSVSYTINKMCPNVCLLRLDFESFTIQGTTNTVEDTLGCASDTFKVTLNTKTTYPTICGQNTGQHMYLDIGAASTDTATLSFAFTGTSTNRQWDIKVTQLPCGSKSNPPGGCLQYQTGLTGRVTSFNFIPTTQTHLPSQDYTVCVRAAVGYCCIQWSVCTDPNSFSLDGLGVTTAGTAAGVSMSSVDSACSTYDYVGIPASGVSCGTSNSASFSNRYCGYALNTVAGLTTSVPICSCQQPFQLNIYTDAVAIQMGATISDSNRGLCLNYMQIPCASTSA